VTEPTPALDVRRAGDPDDPPGSERRYLVIRNANAGAKGGIPTNPSSGEDLRDLLARHDIAADVVETADEDTARETVRGAVADGVDVVVAAGGDGTVGLVASELLDTPTALGVLPFGSVMNIARMLGLPRDRDRAAEILVAGPIATVDVGIADGHVFYEAGSVGMNAAIFREAARFDDGDWLSILRTIWVALRYRPARMRLRLDDREVRTRALMITVSNGPYMGAGMTVAPDARIDDGLFDIRVFRGFSKFELIRHLVSIAFGRRRYAPHVSTYRSRRVRVTSRHPLPARADSQDLGTTPVTFETREAALRVVVPPADRSAD
jgi:diacylglycerol kinase (ATP)